MDAAAIFANAMGQNEAKTAVFLALFSWLKLDGGFLTHHGLTYTQSWSSMTWMIWGRPILGNTQISMGKDTGMYKKLRDSDIPTLI